MRSLVAFLLVALTCAACSVETTIAETEIVTAPAQATDAAPVTEPIAAEEPLYLVDRYDPSRDAAEDLADGLAAAQSSNRQVVLIVGGDWCPDCWNLDAFINDRPDLEAELTERFHFVKVNTSEENYNDEFLADYPSYSWVPHFFIIDPDGTLADSVDTRILMADGVFTDDAFSDFLADN